MSLIIDIDSLDNVDREKINNNLTLKIDNKIGGLVKTLYIYEIINNNIYIPFSYAVTQLNRKRRERNEFSVMKTKFCASLRPEQQIVKDEAIQFLNKTGSVIVSCYTGFGKTVGAISLAQTIKLKTLIIVNKIVLINQWKESIMTFCPEAKVQKLTTKSKFDESADFYIVNAINVEKFGKSFFNDIGLCVIDEAHLIMAETLSRSLKYISPRYLIGLTATPYRPDGFDILLELYFGRNKIIREMNREHRVYMVKTGFKPKMEKTDNGRVNWGAILKAQSEDEKRNDLIVKIVQEFSDRNFLVLTKRVEQGKLLYRKLHDLGENVDSLIGSQQEFDHECRILVGITSKCGTGFDFPKLDALILACDVDQYFIQVLGRVFRKRDTTPYIFDLVDDNPILYKHFQNRKEVYEKTGGKIVNFNKKYPDLLI
jgi:superfamily II DNA or RNA helicase